MRKIDSILIKKVITHVIDMNSDRPLLNDFTQEIDATIHEFLEKHIVKNLQSEDNKKANFRSGEQTILRACESIFDDSDTFVANSQRIAERLFKVMKDNNYSSSCDLVVVLYSFEENDYVAILNLDYSTSFIHQVEFVEDRFKIDIKPQAIGLPGTNKKINKCAFIKRYDEESEYDLIVLDKYVDLKNDDIVPFFVNDFLNCNMILDDRDKTKIFRDSVEKWVRKNLREDIDAAMEVRDELVNQYRNKVDIDPNDFVRQVIDDNDKRDHLVQYLADAGINSKFEIDKDWVEKKIKKRKIKTNTGVKIEVAYEDFKDNSKIEIERNNDGTIDIVVKSVRFTQES
ncbi:MAG: nucleoid-associated protein [Anaeromicrobium sp.]|jgi:nucleoid-associated protein YejK|uniref:nucleoid-associated protein n=1 Tax=Anaeromicrobium sp. TaxID=1929132 RepID=UPI0025F6BCFC|nr:nucleoid-associated protein [Anaeromicrobium sp.]MCT4593159.1 nucleoid-associated protein [Anaeromicrobium sp.]